MTPTDTPSPVRGPEKERRPADHHCDRAVGLRRADTFPDVAIRGDAVVGAGTVVTNNVVLGNRHGRNPCSSRPGTKRTLTTARLETAID